MFNLSKIAQELPTGAIEDMHMRGDLTDIDKDLTEQGEDFIEVNKGDRPQEQFDTTEIKDDQVAQQAEMLVDISTLHQAHDYLMDQGQEGRTAWWALIDRLAAADVANDSRYREVGAQISENPQLQAVEPRAKEEAKRRVESGPLGTTIQEILTDLRNQQQGGNAFMQSVGSKQAQVQALETDVADKGLFVNQYVEDLLAYNGKKGQDDARSEKAKTEILAMVSPAAHEEVNSPLETIQGLSPQIDRQRAEQILAYVFDNWIAPAGVETQMQPQTGMEPVMSEKNPKGIIKFNLSDQVLNNKHTVVKTAADQFGQQYLLYGPTEKRVCPKLRGKGGGYSGSGDVVSEYICRHHCLDGIVIDDNKTICGEALWRANVMDKQSREYVDADGNIKGGYIEKRFEVNHNVPEENKMRLKPGETRKVRPPEWGNTESRMQAMRAAEGKKRGYRPDTNTGDPFKWCTDVDQNNVEQTQAERDRREQAAGHQTVQYTNKGEQENKPKVAFNLKKAQEETPQERVQRRLQGKPKPDAAEEETPQERIKRRLRGQIGETDKQRMLRRMKGAEQESVSKEAKQWMQDAAEDIKEKGTEGDFTSYCGGNVTDDCIERGLAEGGHRAQQANLARQFRKARHKKKSFNLHQIKEAVEMEEITGPYEQLQQMVENDEADLPTQPEEHQINKLKEIRDKATPKAQPAQRKFNLAQGANIPFTDDGHSKSEDGHIEPMKPMAKKEKGVTYKGEHFKYNPWAVCNKSTGGKNEAGEDKFERCVQHVKDQDRENKGKKKKDESKKKS